MKESTPEAKSDRTAERLSAGASVGVQGRESSILTFQPPALFCWLWPAASQSQAFLRAMSLLHPPGPQVGSISQGTCSSPVSFLEPPVGVSALKVGEIPLSSLVVLVFMWKGWDPDSELGTLDPSTRSKKKGSWIC